jgi:subtilase family serine protease
VPRPTLGAIPILLFVVLLLGVPPAGRSTAPGASDRTAVSTDQPSGVGPLAAAPMLSAATSIQVTVVLRPTGYTTLLDLDRGLGARGGPVGPHYLTEPNFLDRFAPAPASVAAVRQYFAEFGGHDFVATRDRFALQFAAPAGPLGEALGTHLVALAKTGAHARYAPRETPTLPSALASLVLSVGGLSNLGSPRLALQANSLLEAPRAVDRRLSNFVADPSRGDQWFLGSDYAQLLNDSALFPGRSSVRNATYATHEAIATILMSGFNDSTQQDLPPFDPVAVAQYFNDTFPPSWPHPIVSGVPVTVAGVTPPLPGYYNGSNDTTLDEEENSLDLEMAGSLAPGATIVNFYFGASVYDARTATTSVASLADDFGAALAAALDHNYSGARLAAVTNSFGLPDLSDSLWNVELLHAEALGVTVVAASGDQGNAPAEASGRFQGQWPTWPATAAFNGSGTVAVGGVSLVASGPGEGTFDGTNLTAGYDGNMTGVSSVTAWYETRAGPGNLSGTEGGVSTVFSEPPWQFRSAAQPTIANVSAQQGVGVLGRTEPDLALPANATIAYVARNSAGVYFDVLEGTSIASPLLAGMLAEMAAVAGHPFGYLSPEVYRIASYFTAHPGAGDPLLDVTAGSNFFFPALPGWDATTGWGLLDPGKFLAADSNPTIRNFTYAGPSPGIPNRPFPPPLTFRGGNGILPLVTLILVGLLGAVVVILVIVLGRRPTPAAPPPYFPYGTWIPPPPGATGGYAPPPPTTDPFTPGGWTLACPYCGRVRPAEPFPCPSCGRL